MINAVSSAPPSQNSGNGGNGNDNAAMGMGKPPEQPSANAGQVNPAAAPPAPAPAPADQSQPQAPQIPEVNTAQNATNPYSAPSPYADSLKEKISSGNSPTQDSILPVPPPNFEPTSDGGGNGGGQNNNGNKKTFLGGLSAKMIIGTVLLVILVLGSGAGLYLSQQSQDIRQQASEQEAAQETSTSSPDSAANTTNSGDTCTPDYGCEYSCSSSYPKQPQINCNLANSDCGTPRERDVCRGTLTNGNCQLRVIPDDKRSAYQSQFPNNTRSSNGWYSCPGDPEEFRGSSNYDYSCACPGADPNTCYEKGPGHDSGQYSDSIACKNIQIDVIRNGGHVWNCTSDDGKAWTECAPPEQPTGVYSAACSPAAPNQTVGNLSYEFKVDGTAPKNFGSAVFYLSLSKNTYPDHLQGFTELTQWLGKPTWSDNCTSSGWCGYWLQQKDDPDPNNSGHTVSWLWDRNKVLNYSGGQANITINSLANKVKELKDAGKLPANYKMNVAVEFRLPSGEVYKFNNQNEKAIDISPYACSAQPESRQYNISTTLICENGSSPTAIPKRMFYAIWPPTPLTWQHQPAIGQPGTTGTITQTINVNNILSDGINNVYVGLTKAEYGEDWDAKGFEGINPPSGFTAATYFNPPTHMIKFPAQSVPSGSYNLQFKAPAELCETPPEPEPLVCNDVCTPTANSADDPCKEIGDDYACTQITDGINRCRNVNYPDSATCEAPAAMCLSISMTPSTPAINDTVRFTCAQVDGIDNYGFRVIQPNGTIDEIGSNGNVSEPYTISESGTYAAECRLCASANCEEWPSDGTNQISCQDNSQCLGTLTCANDIAPSCVEGGCVCGAPGQSPNDPGDPTPTPTPTAGLGDACNINSQCGAIDCGPEAFPICSSNVCSCQNYSSSPNDPTPTPPNGGSEGTACLDNSQCSGMSCSVGTPRCIEQTCMCDTSGLSPN